MARELFDDKGPKEYILKDLYKDKVFCLDQKVTQRTYEWKKLAGKLFEDIASSMDRLNYYNNFDINGNNNTAPSISRNSIDFYNLHYMVTFKNNTKTPTYETPGMILSTLEDGGSRSTALFFGLSIIKKRLEKLKKSNNITDNHFFSYTLTKITELLFCYNFENEGFKEQSTLNEEINLRLYSAIPDYDFIFRTLIIHEKSTAKIILEDKLNTITENSIDAALFEGREKRLSTGYKNVESALKQIVKNMDNNDETNYLIRLTTFILSRVYVVVDENDNNRLLSRLDEAYKGNNRQQEWGVFNKFKLIFQDNLIKRNDMSSTQIEQTLITIHEKLDEASILYGDNDQIDALLKTHYEVKHSKPYIKSNIVKNIEDYFNKKDTPPLDPLKEVLDIVDSARLLKNIKNGGTIPKTITDKFSGKTNDFAKLVSISNRISTRERWYSENFLLLLYKNIDSIDDINVYVNLFERFDTFVANFANFGDGGQGGNDVAKCLSDFGNFIKSNKEKSDFQDNILSYFEKAFFGNETVTKKFSIETAITKFIKVKFPRDGKTKAEARRINTDIEINRCGGIKEYERNVKRTDTDTDEHMIEKGTKKTSDDDIILGLGNVEQLMLSPNCKLKGKPWKAKINTYNKKGLGLQEVAKKYNENFTVENAIEHLREKALLYFEEIKFYHDPIIKKRCITYIINGKKYDKLVNQLDHEINRINFSKGIISQSQHTPLGIKPPNSNTTDKQSAEEHLA